MDHSSEAKDTTVLCLGDVNADQVEQFLQSIGLTLTTVGAESTIPASFWGDPEAGIRKNELFARPDTPLHSILHEACHYLCMSADRKETLDTDAGGDYAEENAVCYLQILMAARLEEFGRARCMADMDRWGYSFRLGSARAWFENDAEDAHRWLIQRGLLADAGERRTFRAEAPGRGGKEKN